MDRTTLEQTLGSFRGKEPTRPLPKPKITGQRPESLPHFSNEPTRSSVEDVSLSSTNTDPTSSKPIRGTFPRKGNKALAASLRDAKTEDGDEDDDLEFNQLLNYVDKHPSLKVESREEIRQKHKTPTSLSPSTKEPDQPISFKLDDDKSEADETESTNLSQKDGTFKNNEDPKSKLKGSKTGPELTVNTSEPNTSLNTSGKAFSPGRDRSGSVLDSFTRAAEVVDTSFGYLFEKRPIRKSTVNQERYQWIHGDDPPDESVKLEIHQDYNRAKTMLPEDLPRWSESLVYSMDVVKEQLKQGSKLCGFLEKFLDRYSKLHASFGAQVMKLVEEESTKLDAFEMPDLMSSLWHTVRTLVEQVYSVGVVHEQHAKDVKRNAMKKVNIVAQQYSQRLDAVSEDHRKVSESFKQARSSLQKKQAHCLKLLSLSENAMTENAGFFNKASMAFSKEDPKEKAYQACVEYEDTINQTNAFLKRLTTKTHPKILEDMQDLEQFRHILMAQSMDTFGASFSPVGAAYHTLSKASTQLMEIINLKKDLENMERNCNTQIDRAKYSFNYDLPVTVPELTKFISIQFRKKVGNGTFHSFNLHQWMDLQRDDYPELKMPILFYRMRYLLRKTEAHNVEGIFRISPSESVLVDFIEQLKRGEPLGGTIDPHLVATSLKQWLRSFDPPLFPHDIYNDYVKNGKICTQEDGAFILSRLPEESRTLLMSLVHIAREMEANKISKMDFSALAVVFAPSVFQGGGDASLTMGMEAMNKSKHEVAFLSSFFANTPIDAKFLQFECDQTLSADIESKVGPESQIAKPQDFD